MQPPYSLTINVQQDKMAAELIMEADNGDFTISLRDLNEAIEKAGIVFGIDRSILENICEKPKKYVNIPVIVARGNAPIPGTDAHVEYVFQQVESNEMKPKLLEDGRVDYYAVNKITNISRGQLLAKKIPAESGQNGTTVTGDVVKPTGGKDVHIKVGKNVVLSEDRMLLYATIDGQVSITEDKKINVFPVYEVNGDVDFNIGNIDFIGTVVIRGNIPTGFKIKASGDIRVYGSVEGAELEAGGTVEIKNGIVAQDKGYVRAGVDVISSYIQNANVTAGNEVIVAQSIMFSNIRAGKNVICTRTKGIIIGGLIQAGERIIARIIGNQSSTPTTLEVGVKPELRNEWQQVSKELQSHHENLRKTDQGLAVLNQMQQSMGELPGDRKLMLIKLTNTRIVLEKEIGSLVERQRELEREIEGDNPALVEVQSIMYPGIKLVFGKMVRFVKQEFSRTRFMVIDGEITTTTLL